MLLLLFVVVTDNGHMAMDCSTTIVFFLVGSISSGKKAKELEVGSGYIGWTVGHTWCTCANVLLMTGNYYQGYRNTKQSRPSVLWLT